MEENILLQIKIFSLESRFENTKGLLEKLAIINVINHLKRKLEQ